MAFIVADRVRETTDSLGVGTVTLAGAIAGYQTFEDAIGVNNTCYYTITNAGYDEWEVGVGTVGVGTLARTTVLKSSNNDEAVPFSGGHKDIFVTYPAGKTVMRDPSGQVGNLGAPSYIDLTSGISLPLETGVTGILDPILGGTGVDTIDGIIKGNGLLPFSVAQPNIDFLPSTIISDIAIQKADGSGGLTDAYAGTDYASPTPYTYSMLASDGSGGFLEAIVTSGLNYDSGFNTLSFIFPDAGIAVSSGSAWGTSLTAPSGAIVGTSDTQTLTNKRITPRVGTVVSSTGITPTGDASDIYTVTALAADATINAPSGTPTNGQQLLIRINDNGTGRALLWNAIYRGIGLTLPSTTTATKVLYLGCVYNTQSSTWDVVASAQLA
jgi:hypothetical protein